MRARPQAGGVASGSQANQGENFSKTMSRMEGLVR